MGFLREKASQEFTNRKEKEYNSISKFRAEYRKQLKIVKTECKEFEIIEEFRDNRNSHPIQYVDFECEFATEFISKFKPNDIVDIGSYRHWLIGLMSYWRVTTLDVRERESGLENELVITQDVINMDLPVNYYDMAVSLSTIEHFGLGRYGDKFEINADKIAIKNIINIIKPGGYFIFSIPVTQGKPCLSFNSHRIYSKQMIYSMVDNMELVAERFVKKEPVRICQPEEITNVLGDWDVYCGCFKKS